MIIDFGISTVGKSHIKKGTCCQDSHYIKTMQNGWVIAAVADGVGSAKNSHIGSKIAVETVVEFCDECMPWDFNIISIKSMMRTAYNYAFKQILRESQQSGEPIESYDTTLSMVIYDGQRIIYGHSGDGAIFALTTFGDYVEITRPQKSADGVSVIPLRGGYTQWVIDTYEEDLSAVLLMTDGMLETLCHYLLRDHEKKTNRAYIPLMTYFADPNGFDVDNLKKIKKEIFDFVVAEENYESARFYDRLLEIYRKHVPENAEEIIEKIRTTNYPISLMQAEQDDKTILGLINIDLAFDDKDAVFYAEPDWNALQDAWNRKAYPHLYAEKQDDTANALTNDTESETGSGSITENAGTVSEVGSSGGEDPGEVTENNKKTHDADSVDAVLLIFEKKDSSDAVDDTVKPVDSSKKTATKKKPQPNASMPSETPLPARPKHEKPKRKGLIGKIGDLFD